MNWRDPGRRGSDQRVRCPRITSGLGGYDCAWAMVEPQEDLGLGVGEGLLPGLSFLSLHVGPTPTPFTTQASLVGGSPTSEPSPPLNSGDLPAGAGGQSRTPIPKWQGGRQGGPFCLACLPLSHIWPRECVLWQETGSSGHTVNQNAVFTASVGKSPVGS